MLVWLTEITARVPGSPSTEVLRVASYPGFNAPDAPGLYPARLESPAIIRRTISNRSLLPEQSEINSGELVIDNIDGAYDAWLDYGYGDTARMLLVDSNDAYLDALVVLTGTVDQPRGDERTIRFYFRDRTVALDIPASPATYTGQNLESPNSLIEGTAEDLKGRNKIRLVGKALNIDADPVNTAEQVFALNHDINGGTEAIAAVNAVRVNGSPWGNASPGGGNFATLATLIAAMPAQGDYDTCLAEGLVALGGTIGQGLVTIDATERSTASENHVASILSRLLIEAGETVVSADVTALESAAPYNAGAVIRGETYRQALDTVRVGALAWVLPNRLGQWNIRRVAVPTGSPAATFRKFVYPNVAEANDFEVRDLKRLPPIGDAGGAPVWQVTVNYAPMQVVQSADALASGLSEADKAKYSRPYRSITVESQVVRSQYPLAGTYSLNTTLTEEADAQTLANNLLTLLGSVRNMYRLVAGYNAPLAGAIDLGDVVRVYFDRFGLASGQLMRIHAIQYDIRKREVELELWH